MCTGITHRKLWALDTFERACMALGTDVLTGRAYVEAAQLCMGKAEECGEAGGATSTQRIIAGVAVEAEGIMGADSVLNSGNLICCFHLLLFHVHFDLHSGAAPPKAGRNQSKITPYFIDWQYICIGKGVQDLVFFMIESFEIDTINKYKNIFKYYYYIKLIEN